MIIESLLKITFLSLIVFLCIVIGILHHGKIVHLECSSVRFFQPRFMVIHASPLFFFFHVCFTYHHCSDWNIVTHNKIDALQIPPNPSTLNISSSFFWFVSYPANTSDRFKVGIISVYWRLGCINDDRCRRVGIQPTEVPPYWVAVLG